MKACKLPVIITLLFILLASSSFNTGEISLTNNSVQDTLIIYKDGVWVGKSQASYTDEPYWGIVKVTVKDGKFEAIKFVIRDSSLHETFNEKYAFHFKDNPVYVQQCREDWKGVQTYPGRLSLSQNPGKIDAISGATWSYNIFIASLKDALKGDGYHLNGQ